MLLDTIALKNIFLKMVQVGNSTENNSSGASST